MENENKQKCSKCQKSKDFNCFHKNSKCKNGLHSQCKECKHNTYIENRDKISEFRKNEYYPKNRNHILKHRKWILSKKRCQILWYFKNKYYPKNRDKILEHMKEYRNCSPYGICDCEKVIEGVNFSKHLNSQYHKRYIDENKETTSTFEIKINFLCNFKF